MPDDSQESRLISVTAREQLVLDNLENLMDRVVVGRVVRSDSLDLFFNYAKSGTLDRGFAKWFDDDPAGPL